MSTSVEALAPPPTGAVGAGSPTFSALARPRRRKLVWIVPVLLLALAVTAIGSLTTWPWPGSGAGDAVTAFSVEPRSFAVTLKEKGELKAARSTDVISEVEGRTTVISLIPEGTQVQKGDLLVELASDKIEDRIRQEELKEANALTAYEKAKADLEIQRDKNAADIRKAQLQIELKRLALSRYEEGDWQQQLKDADIAIEQARIMLDRNEADWKAAQELWGRNFITRTEYEEDQFQYQKAQWDLEKAIMAKKVLETYTHVAELRQRQSDLDEAVKEAERVRKQAEAEETQKLRALEGAEKELLLIRDQLAKLREQRTKCRITAPTQGFVVYYGGDGGRWYMQGDALREGAEVHERQILMQLPDTSEMLAVVRIHEAKTNKLKLGQSVHLTIEGIPGWEFTGKVTKIAAVADTQNRWLNPDLKEYETEIAIDPTDVPLKPGVTAHVEILVEHVEERLTVPVQSVFTKSGRRFVFRMNGKQVEPVSILLGSVSTEWAEVVDGLNAGERIVLAISDDLKRMIPDVQSGARGGPPGTDSPERARMKQSEARGTGQTGSHRRAKELGKAGTVRRSGGASGKSAG